MLKLGFKEDVEEVNFAFRSNLIDSKNHQRVMQERYINLFVLGNNSLLGETSGKSPPKKEL